MKTRETRHAVIYQLQQEAAEVRPHSVRLCRIGAGEADHIEEQALVDVKVLKIKSFEFIGWTFTLGRSRHRV